MNGGIIRLAPVILLAVLAGLTWWLNSKLRIESDLDTTSLKNQPDFYIEGYLATRMDSLGKKLYTLKGDELAHFSQKESTVLNNPFLIYHDDVEGPMTFSANEATLSNNGEDLYFNGNVRIKWAKLENLDSLEMRTSYLHIMPEEEIARTNKNITLLYNNSTMSAVGLEFHNKTRTFYLLSKIQAQYENPTLKP